MAIASRLVANAAHNSTAAAARSLGAALGGISRRSRLAPGGIGRASRRQFRRQIDRKV